MIVKYINEQSYQGEGKDPDFTLGKDYIILGVFFNDYHKIHNVVLQRQTDNDPVVLELKYFDIIDGRVPENWVFKDVDKGYYRLQPKEFYGNFWNKFHDGDEEAEKVYRDIVNKIYEFHGMEPFYKPEPPKKEPLKDHEWWKEYDEAGNKTPEDEGT